MNTKPMFRPDRVAQRARRAVPSGSHEQPALFRAEAVAHQRERSTQAEPLRLAPDATAWLHRLLLAAAALALFFLSVGRLNEYAGGPALVRIEGRTAISTSHSALVSHVEVTPGQRVEQDAVLVRLYAAEEAAELEAATREFNDQLLKLMQRPDDQPAREALVALRARRELARAQLAQRTLRAPHPGVVADVRARPGQLVEPGVALLELQGERGAAEVIAMLPGRARPLLQRGAKLRFELDGFARRTHELTVDHVAEQIIGPSEAARYLGRDVADALPLTGPVVLVRAPLPDGSFEADGERFRFAHGMNGKAETIVRDEPLLYAFVPGLEQWVEHVW